MEDKKEWVERERERETRRGDENDVNTDDNLIYKDDEKEGA